MSRSGILVRAALAALVASLLSCGQGTGTGPVTAKELDSPSLLGSTSGSPNYIHAFASTGIYPYHCIYHTTAHHRMGGMVVVTDQGADSAFVSIFQGSYHPDTTRVKTGAPVRWQNFDDGTHHTVTSD